MLLSNFILHNIDTHFNKTDKLLLAISGGIDSMVLLNVCVKLELDICVAHANFQLRNEESDGDENFIKNICSKNKLVFHTQKFDTKNIMQNYKKGVQETARHLRYEWFDALLQTHKFNYILTAHHLNDNVETVLINFCKGTGIKGLRGIKAKQGNIIRPLLWATKTDIIMYAKLNNIEHREDASNLKNTYTRNHLRLNVIPSIEEKFPQFQNIIGNNIKRFAEIEKIYDLYFEGLKSRIFKYNQNNINVAVKILLMQKPLHTILYELFKDYGLKQQQVAELIKLLYATSGKYLLSTSHKFLINRKVLIIHENTIINNDVIYVPDALPFNKKIVNALDIKIECLNNILESDKNLVPDLQRTKVFFLDKKNIDFPLIIRRKIEGDYFYPLGLGKKRKLKKYFNDLKLSAQNKEMVWVVESSQKIICVLPHEIDNRFKINNNTKEFIKIAFKC